MTTNSNDLHAAAHHEAAHAVVAEHLGCGPRRIELESRSRDGATWFSGRFHHAGGGPHAQRMVGLAGAIGEVLCGPLASNWGPALINPTVALISSSDAEAAGVLSQ